MIRHCFNTANSESMPFTIGQQRRCTRSVGMQMIAHIWIAYLFPSRVAFSVPIIILGVISEFWSWEFNPPTITKDQDVARLIMFFVLTAIGAHLLVRVERINRWRFECQEAMEEAQTQLLSCRRKIEGALGSVCSGSTDVIAFARGERAIEGEVEVCSVCISEIHDFLAWTNKMKPGAVIATTNSLFSTFDELTNAYEVERGFATGDTYCCTYGLRDSSLSVADLHDPAKLLAFALKQLSIVGDRQPQLAMRIGIGTGPCNYSLFSCGNDGMAFYVPHGAAVRDATLLLANVEPNQLTISGETARRCDSRQVEMATLSSGLTQVHHVSSPAAQQRQLDEASSPRPNGIISGADDGWDNFPLSKDWEASCVSTSAFLTQQLEVLHRRRQNLADAQENVFRSPLTTTKDIPQGVVELSHRLVHGEHQQLTAVMFLLDAMVLVVGSIQSALTRGSTILVGAALLVCAATALAPRRLGRWMSWIHLASTSLQLLLVFCSASTMGPCVLNGAITWLIVAAVPPFVHAGLGVPYLVVGACSSVVFAGGSFVFGLLQGVPPTPNVTEGVVAIPVAGILSVVCLIFVCARQESAQREAVCRLAMKEACMDANAVALATWRDLLHRFIPPIYIERLLKVKGSIAEAIDDIAMLEMRFPCTDYSFVSSSSVGNGVAIARQAAVRFKAVQDAVARNSATAIISFTGDRLAVGGPLVSMTSRPTTADAERLEMTEMGGFNHQQSSGMDNSYASSSAVQILAIYDGLATVVCTSHPHLVLQGTVAHVAQGLLKAAVRGQCVATDEFVQLLPGGEATWRANALSIGSESEPWRVRGLGMIRVFSVHRRKHVVAPSLDEGSKISAS